MYCLIFKYIIRRAEETVRILDLFNIQIEITNPKKLLTSVV